MQDYPLTVHHVFWRIERLFGEREIVTRREAGRAPLYQRGPGQTRLPPGERAAQHGRAPGRPRRDVAWNNYRHLELYYAVPLLGAVLHTLNMRLFTDQLEFVIRERRTVSCLRTPAWCRCSQNLPASCRGRRADRRPGRRGESVPRITWASCWTTSDCLRDEDEHFDWPAIDERAAGRDVLHERHHRQSERRRVYASFAVPARDGRDASRQHGHRGIRRDFARRCRCSTPIAGVCRTRPAWLARSW